jgi:hypothetical protein
MKTSSKTKQLKRSSTSKLRENHHISWCSFASGSSGAQVRITDFRQRNALGSFDVKVKFFSRAKYASRRQTFQAAREYRDQLGPILQGTQWNTETRSTMRWAFESATAEAYSNSCTQVAGVSYTERTRTFLSRSNKEYTYLSKNWIATWREVDKDGVLQTRKREFAVTKFRSFKQAFELAYKFRYMKLKQLNKLPRNMRSVPPDCPSRTQILHALQVKTTKSRTSARLALKDTSKARLNQSRDLSQAQHSHSKSKQSKQSLVDSTKHSASTSSSISVLSKSLTESRRRSRAKQRRNSRN